MPLNSTLAPPLALLRLSQSCSTVIGPEPLAPSGIFIVLLIQNYFIMKKNIFLLIALASFFLFSCKEDTITPEKSLIYGIWTVSKTVLR